MPPPLVGYARLRPSIEVIERETEVLLVGDRSIVYGRPDRALRRALGALARPDGVECSALAQIMGQWSSALDLLKALHRRKVLQIGEHPFAPPAGDRTQAYFQSAVAEPQKLRDLREISVVVVGCGGVGGELARHLVSAGVGQLHLVDGDCVEESNLNRQYLFRLEDVGARKVEAAREALRAVSRSTQVCVHDLFVRELEDLEGLDVAHVDAVACCADQPLPAIWDIVCRYAAARQSIFAMASVGLLEGTWGPILMPEQLVNFRPPWGAFEEIEPLRASFGPTNSFVSAALARDLIHVLIGDRPPRSVGARMRVDFDDHSLHREPVFGDADLEPAENPKAPGK